MPLFGKLHMDAEIQSPVSQSLLHEALLSSLPHTEFLREKGLCERPLPMSRFDPNPPGLPSTNANRLPHPTFPLKVPISSCS